MGRVDPPRGGIPDGPTHSPGGDPSLKISRLGTLTLNITLMFMEPLNPKGGGEAVRWFDLKIEINRDVFFQENTFIIDDSRLF